MIETCFDLKLHFDCNNNCVHCVVADKRPFKALPLERVLEIVDNCNGVTSIQLTGGEPTIYPGFIEVLKKCKEKNLYVIVQTNGTSFDSNSFCEEHLPYIDYVHIAIHSCYPEVHDKIVQGVGQWDRTIKGFYNLIEYGKTNPDFKMTTQTVVTKLNIETVFDTFSFIQSKAPGICMSLTYPHMMGNAWSNRELYNFRYSDYREELSKIFSTYHENMFVESIPPCYLHPYTDLMVKSVEYDIRNNVIDRTGIDFSDGFSTKDYNMRDVVDRRKAPKCRECIYNNECIGVWKEYIEMFKKSLDLFPITNNEELNN